jgi:hypothetical protein
MLLHARHVGTQDTGTNVGIFHNNNTFLRSLHFVQTSFGSVLGTISTSSWSQGFAKRDWDEHAVRVFEGGGRMKSAHCAILDGACVLNPSRPRRKIRTAGVGDQSPQGFGLLRLRLVHDSDVHSPEVEGGSEATHPMGAAGGELLDLDVVHLMHHVARLAHQRCVEGASQPLVKGLSHETLASYLAPLTHHFAERDLAAPLEQYAALVLRAPAIDESANHYATLRLPPHSKSKGTTYSPHEAALPLQHLQHMRERFLRVRG